MSLKAAVSADEHAALDATVGKLYRAEGDAFVLDVEESQGWALDKPTDLRNGLKAERKRNEAARKALDVLGDVDPRAARDAYERVTELEEKLRELSATKAGKETADLESRVAKATEKLTAEIAAAKKQSDEYRAALTGRGLRDELRAAIRAAAPDAADVDAITDLMLPHVERRTATEYNGSGLVVKVIGRDGQPDISGKPGSTEAKTLTELVSEMKGEGPFTRVFAKPGAEGFRGRTSAQPAGSRARTASADTSQPERVSPMELLRQANAEALNGSTSGAR